MTASICSPALVALVALSITFSNPARFLRADHYGAFVVGLIVVATGLRVMYESAMQLMDTMPDERSMSRIREVALSVADVAGVEKCFARKTGLKYHVDLHLEVDPGDDRAGIARNRNAVRDQIRAPVPWVADVLVHVEPAQ